MGRYVGVLENRVSIGGETNVERGKEKNSMILDFNGKYQYELMISVELYLLVGYKERHERYYTQ